MTLSAQIAIGPSRVLAALEAAMLLGAAVCVTACVAVTLAPALAATSVAGAIVIASAVAHRAWKRRTSAPIRHLSLDASADVGYREADGALQRAALADGTLCWPGLAVVVLSVEDRAGLRSVPVFDADLARERGRQLRRFLIWRQRTGERPGARPNA